MPEMRQLLSILFLSTSIYLVFDLFSHGFSLFVLAGVVIFYILAYYTWPKQEKETESAWLEIAELIVELPYRLIASLLRGFGRVLSNKSGPDFDIDL